MAKLKLSKRDIGLVEDSIKHWKRDMQAKLKRGIKIIPFSNDNTCLVWTDNKRYVACYAHYCPLCNVYGSEIVSCSECPYFRKYYEVCYQKDWRIFIENPCLKTCNGMIKSLENILK